MRRPAANNLTENEMREAIKLEAKIFEDETKPHMNRYSRVQSLIAKELLEGKLQARLRPEWGGEFSDILEPAIWNTERSIKTRFINCMLKSSDPFGKGFAGEGFCYIFLTTTSLQQTLDRLKKEFRKASKKKGAAAKEGRASEAQLRDWFTDLINDRKVKGLGKLTIKEVQDRGMERFPNSSPNQIYQVCWKRLAPHEWRKTGKFNRAD